MGGEEGSKDAGLQCSRWEVKAAWIRRAVVEAGGTVIVQVCSEGKASGSYDR